MTSATGGDHNSFPGGEKMFGAYSQALNLRQVHFGEDMKAAENQDFISQGSTNNATCFLGPHRVYDPFTKSFMNLIPGQGHVRRSRCSRIRHRSTLRSPPLRLLRSLAPTRFRAVRAPPHLAPRCALLATRSRARADARWRRGESVSLKTARDTLVPLELAQHAQMVYTQRS